MFHSFSVFQVAANYYGSRKQYEPVPGRPIYWAGGVEGPPKDKPVCGFDGSGCPPVGMDSSTFIYIVPFGLIGDNDKMGIQLNLIPNFSFFRSLISPSSQSFLPKSFNSNSRLLQQIAMQWLCKEKITKIWRKWSVKNNQGYGRLLSHSISLNW